MQLFALSGVAFVLLFYYVPMSGLLMAFKKFKIQTGYAGIFTSQWVGFKWFIEFFTDYNFRQLLVNTLGISLLKMAFTFPVPLILAIALNEVRHRAIKRVVQTASYLPYFISWVVVSGFCLQFFSTNDGVVNKVLVATGLADAPQYFLSSPDYFWQLVVGTGIWKEMGWGTIIFLAAITSVDPTLYEAAMIDGAGRVKRIWHIILPSIAPTVTVVLILAIGNLLGGGLGGSTFEQCYLLGNTANRSASDIFQTYSFRIGLSEGRYSYATAIGMIQSVVSVILVFGSNAISKATTGNGLF
jgi:putative aldouronate transport system permease protein